MADDDHGDDFERRDVLKATGVGIGAAGLASSGATASSGPEIEAEAESPPEATGGTSRFSSGITRVEPASDGQVYQIAIWQTGYLKRHTSGEYAKPWRALNRAQQFVAGAFERSKHGVEILAPRYGVPVRNHTTSESFGAIPYCNHHTKKNYDGALDRFSSWFSAKCTAWPEAAHANLLLGHGHNPTGGDAVNGGTYSVAEGGPFIADLREGYRSHGYDKNTKAMWEALHYLGHNLLESGVDSDGDGVGHHDLGMVVKYDSGNTITPLGLKGEGVLTNDCGNVYDKSSATGYELTWSDCAVKNFKSGASSFDELPKKTASIPLGTP